MSLHNRSKDIHAYLMMILLDQNPWLLPREPTITAKLRMEILMTV